MNETPSKLDLEIIGIKLEQIAKNLAEAKESLVRRETYPASINLLLAEIDFDDVRAHNPAHPELEKIREEIIQLEKHLNEISLAEKIRAQIRDWRGGKN